MLTYADVCMDNSQELIEAFIQEFSDLDVQVREL
jgi:hypothetical protein